MERLPRSESFLHLQLRKVEEGPAGADLQIKPPSGEPGPRGILMTEHGAVVMLASGSLWGFGFASPCCPLYHGIC